MRATNRKQGDERPTGEQFVSHREVQRRLGCSDVHVWRLRHDSRYAHLKFPKPRRTGLGRSGRLMWVESELDAWILARAAAAAAGEAA